MIISVPRTLLPFALLPREIEARGVPGDAAVKHNYRHVRAWVKPRLRRPVDGKRVGDGGQGGYPTRMVDRPGPGMSKVIKLALRARRWLR